MTKIKRMNIATLAIGLGIAWLMISSCNRSEESKVKAAELIRMCANGNCARVKQLLEEGCDPDVQTGDGVTAIFSADAGTARLLLEHGASIEVVDKKTGYTPIYTARDVETFRIMIKHGADVNAYTEGGITPLHVVSDSSIAEELIKSGATVNAGTHDGDTPTDLAENDGRAEIASVLRKHGGKGFDELPEGEQYQGAYWKK